MSKAARRRWQQKGNHGGTAKPAVVTYEPRPFALSERQKQAVRRKHDRLKAAGPQVKTEDSSSAPEAA